MSGDGEAGPELTLRNQTGEARAGSWWGLEPAGPWAGAHLAAWLNCASENTKGTSSAPSGGREPMSSRLRLDRADKCRVNPRSLAWD